jgi:16S rRNA (guanine966-N2)-methyltransferase
VRPTADKVRAAIFNILANRIDVAGQRWLDLFAGSGAMGLDALSRGAAHVTFVDESAESCRFVRDNAERAGFAERSHVRRLQLPQAVRALGRSGERFDGAFVDPPYNQGLADATLQVLGDSCVLTPGAWVVVEHAAKEPLGERYGALRRDDARRYGSTALTLYAMEEES